MHAALTKDELKRRRIGVLMGGLSSEREISLKTGNAILRALKAAGYQVLGIDADRSLARVLEQERIEIAFIALHGPWGEDGTVQGLLEMMGIPYTGSSVAASAIAMDKAMAKKLFLGNQLPTPAFEVLRPDEGAARLSLSLPAVVKPVCGGSSIGIKVVRTGAELADALEKAARYDNRLLVEKYVDGKDLTVGIIEEEVLPVIEIIPKSGFYDFFAKYNEGETEYLVPAPLPAASAAAVQAMAVSAYRALSCSGAARVDFRMDPAGELMILEVNTIPGMTETSLLPKAAALAGIDFVALTERILASARLHIGCAPAGQ